MSRIGGAMANNKHQRVPTESMKIDKSTVKRLFKYLLKYKYKLIVVVIFIISSSVVTAITARGIGTLIDGFIVPLIGTQNPSFEPLITFLLVLCSMFLVGIISAFVYSRLMVDISQGVLKTIRDNMFSHMQKLPIKYFDTHTNGDVMSHYINDTDTLRQMLSQGVPQILSAIITILSITTTMLLTSIHLTVVVGATLVIMILALKFIAGKSGKYFMKQQETLGDLNGYIEEIMAGQRVVKVFSYEDDTIEAFDIKNEVLRKSGYKANSYASALMPTMMNLGILQYVILAIVGGILITQDIGGVKVGIVVSFLLLSRNFNMPIAQVSQQLNSIVMAFAGAERIFKLLDEKVEIDNGYVTLVNMKYENDKIVETNERTGMWAWKHPHKDGTLTYTKLTGEVDFLNVDFGYTEQRLVLKNITLKAKEGQKIALIGSTGAGKTTITNLINRFYDIADGKIKYDNITINKIKKEDLRRSLGVVLQETNLFTGTVIENIRYGRLDATDEECIEASKKANAHYFIGLLKDGYNTVISGDGESISQGQRQLLSIARAIVADPPVMILDEATSSIDTHTEAIVQKGMDMLMSGRTVFVIAHRLSTIQNSDVILVLESGEIIERGNHQELMDKKGKYYQLNTGDFELE